MAQAKLPGGYYIVNGKPVDANGEPIPAEKLKEAGLLEEPAEVDEKHAAKATAKK